MPSAPRTGQPASSPAWVNQHDDRHVPQVDGQRPRVEHGDQPMLAGTAGENRSSTRMNASDHSALPSGMSLRSKPRGPGCSHDPRPPRAAATAPASPSSRRDGAAGRRGGRSRAATRRRTGRGPGRSGAGVSAGQRDHRQGRVRHGDDEQRATAEQRQQQRREQHQPEEVAQIPGRAQRLGPHARRPADPAAGRTRTAASSPSASPPISMAGTAIGGQHPQRRQQAAQPPLHRERPGPVERGGHHRAAQREHHRHRREDDGERGPAGDVVEHHPDRRPRRGAGPGTGCAWLR